MKVKTSIVAIVVLGFMATLQAQVPRLINYQGVLTHPTTGAPLTGSYSIQFSIYDVAIGGMALWAETQNVTATDGLFNVLLGSTVLIPYTVFDGNDKYLGVKVDADPEMTPRKRLVSVGYAFRAYEADRLDGKHASEFVGAGQANSISTAMIQDNAVTAAKIAPNIVSSVDGVVNDGGNIDLVAGSNITITPDDVNNQITISASGVGGDNLGNHIATQNIQLRSYWLSGDGGNEGIRVDGSGNVGVGNASPGQRLDVTGDIRATAGYIITGSPTSPGGLSAEDISSTDDVLADDIIRAGNFVAAGLPSGSHGTGDVVADDDLVADDALEIGGAASVAGNVNSTSGYITTGTPDSPGGLSASDISSTDDCLADDIIRAGNFVAAGLPSSGHGTGDVVADDDLVADDDVEVGDDITADYIFATRGSGSAVRATYYILAGNIGGVSIPEGITTGDLVAEDDVLAHDDILGLGTKSAVLQTASFGARRMYADESAGVYFFDRGEARLVNGEVTIHLDPIFSETVTIDRDNPLLVQITLNADCKGVYVAERTATSFIVRELGGGTSNASFSWEAAAKRRGYEATRLEAIPAIGVTEVPEPKAEEASVYSQDQPNGPEVKDAVAKPEEEPAPASNDR